MRPGLIQIHLLTAASLLFLFAILLVLRPGNHVAPKVRKKASKSIPVASVPSEAENSDWRSASDPLRKAPPHFSEPSHDLLEIEREMPTPPEALLNDVGPWAPEVEAPTE